MAIHAKRIALVTGANKGIGFEISRGIASQGCHCRHGSRHTDPAGHLGG